MRRKIVLVSALAFAIAAPFAVKVSGFLFNPTDSVPVGLYRRALDGPFAALCLPDGVIAAARKRGLDLSGGDCANGSVPILKPLFVASAEHPIRLTEAGFVIDGKLLPNTAPKRLSRTGVPMQHYHFGDYRSGIWAISEFNPDSFDSRYFGPVGPGTIRYRARPVWMW